jgi:hypothetical protein
MMDDDNGLLSGKAIKECILNIGMPPFWQNHVAERINAILAPLVAARVQLAVRAMQERLVAKVRERAWSDDLCTDPDLNDLAEALSELPAPAVELEELVGMAYEAGKLDASKVWDESTRRVLNNPVSSIELNSFVGNYWKPQGVLRTAADLIREYAQSKVAK